MDEYIKRSCQVMKKLFSAKWSMDFKHKVHAMNM